MRLTENCHQTVRKSGDDDEEFKDNDDEVNDEMMIVMMMVKVTVKTMTTTARFSFQKDRVTGRRDKRTRTQLSVLICKSFRSCR